MSAPAMGRRPRRLVRVAMGVALGGALLGFERSLGFAPAGLGSSVAVPGADSGSPLVADRLDAPRGEAPRTQMHAKYPDRSRKNAQGGGRLPIKIDRKPVLAYSTTQLESQDQFSKPESANSVIRRMWDMYDMNYNKMALQRQQFFRSEARNKKWTADFNMRVGQKKKAQRIKRQYDEEWGYWMRTEGRQKGLSDPIIFAGPPLAQYATPEMDKASEPRNVKKLWGTEAEAAEKWKTLPKGRDRLPLEVVEPGTWDNGETNIYNFYKRPLNPWPYDIGKRGSKKIVYGNVI